MIFSMTGFGRVDAVLNNKQVTIEVKSLNGKQLDINLRLAPQVRVYENELRQLLASTLQRGSIECNIVIRQDGAAKAMMVNKEMAKSYYHSVVEIAQELGLEQKDLLNTIMRMPEVVAPGQDILDEKEWSELKIITQDTLSKLMEHRAAEGQSLEKDLKKCIDVIQERLCEVEPHESQRIERVRQKFELAFKEWISSDKFDLNRLEHELIYFIEKMDISEEKTRLKQHCVYFMEIMHNKEIAKGKKLGFILQEIGREINTLGSKANDVNIQKLVVGMKDVLERAKEQVLNVM